MDNLHGVLRTLQGERKADKPADHLTVFRDFIAHLDRLAREKPKATRAKASRVVKKKAKR